MGPQDAPHTPVYAIAKGGQYITGNLQDRAVAITVTHYNGDGQTDTLQIVADDRDWALAEPSVGDVIQLWLGYEEIPSPAFQGSFAINEVVNSWPPRQMSITADGVDFRGPLKSQINHQYGPDTTLGEVVQTIASRNGMTADVDGDLGALAIPFYNTITSSLDVLVELEKLYGAVLKIMDGNISFAKRGSNQTPGGVELDTIQLLPEHIAQGQVLHNNRSLFTETHVQYKEKGNDNLQTAVAKSLRADKVILGPDGKEKAIVSKVFGLQPGKAAAERIARAQMDALDRTLGEGLFVLHQGDPWIGSGRRLSIVGARDGIDGIYVTDIVSHSLTKEQGLMTTIRTKAPIGSEAAFLLPYAQDVLTPGIGQVTGDVLPHTPNTDNANPTRMPDNEGNTEAGGGRTR